MPRLNHLNLPCSNVLELTRFFTGIFGFRQTGQAGQGKFAVLLGDDDFVLVLMHDKNLETRGYPEMFHTGFLVPSRVEVDQHHAAILAAGFEAPTPAMMKRGGPPAYGFYCVPSGGVMVEVSTMAES